jgi:prepilin-type processing-associated H-X9-DG protein
MRGYLAWRFAEHLKFLSREKRNIAFFDFHATLIQKVYAIFSPRE